MMDKYVYSLEHKTDLLPCLTNIKKFINSVKEFFFPNFFTCQNEANNPLEEARDVLKIEIDKVFKLTNDNRDVDSLVEKIMNSIVELIPVIKSDLKSFYEGDPAAEDYVEIIITYPGFKALVKAGDQVKRGQKLTEFDPDFLALIFILGRLSGKASL